MTALKWNVALAIAAWGQQRQNPAPPALVTHAACVDSSARSLGVFIGDYDVDAAFRSGNARWDSSRARSRFTWALAGCIMREEFVGAVSTHHMSI